MTTTDTAAAERLLLRGLGVVAVAAIGLLHLVQLPDAWHPTPGLAALFTILVAACGMVIAAFVYADNTWVWHAAALTAAGPIVGYIATRSADVPFDHEDVGNWNEPLGLVSLAIEGALVALYIWRLVAVRSAPDSSGASRRANTSVQPSANLQASATSF